MTGKSVFESKSMNHRWPQFVMCDMQACTGIRHARVWDTVVMRGIISYKLNTWFSFCEWVRTKEWSSWSMLFYYSLAIRLSIPEEALHSSANIALKIHRCLKQKEGQLSSFDPFTSDFDVSVTYKHVSFNLNVPQIHKISDFSDQPSS